MRPSFSPIGLLYHRWRWDARHLARRLPVVFKVTGSCRPTRAAYLWGGLCALIAGSSVSLVWGRAGRFGIAI